MAGREMNKSQVLFEEAKRWLVGGVNSPVRAMKPHPFFTARGEGCRIYDVDGRSYIDYCLAYGPLILGHAYPKIVKAVKEQLEKGTVYGTPTELEVKFAKKIVEHVPSAEVVRFVNTGTEATMAAIRLARGCTGRKKIIKFEGAFHGAHDYVLVKAGSGATTHGVPNSLGIPEETTKNTLPAPFNSEEAVEKILKREKDVAAIILEPVIGNAGCIMPKEGYLQFLREITEKNNVLLIFDEVITGYRLCLGGAQKYYNVTPDVTTLGKIIGGGLPVGAVTARREIMEYFSPVGKVYQAGTFNANPLSMVAGYAAVSELEKGMIYKKLEKLGSTIRGGLKKICEELKIKAKVYGAASMFQIYFTNSEVVDYRTALKANAEFFLKFQRELLKKGIFLPPSQYECNFISYAHGENEIDRTLRKVEEVFRRLRCS
ncbi:MAG: glutamate-1-semialdehyde 2,1-aminomutase [Candidatus Hydrothermarchaeota archaeon]|nr:glutamate-1-semialdehyde 2,1-aminomutase [Candidatus Hydrothermarchaeota archaeon]